MKILYITERFPRWPFPGDESRTLNQLRLLGRGHDVTLLAFEDSTLDRTDRAYIEDFCERTIVVPVSLGATTAAVLRNLFTTLPLQAMRCQTSAMRTAVRAQLRRGFDLVHVQNARMAEYVRRCGTPVVVDLTDVRSAAMERAAAKKSGLQKAALEFEARRLLAYKRLLCKDASAVCVASARDRDVLGARGNLFVNWNGLDLSRITFDPEHRAPRSIAFNGNMAHASNVAAVTWFAREVLPLVAEEIPEVTFEILGPNPTRDVRALVHSDVPVAVIESERGILARRQRAQVEVFPMLTPWNQSRIIEAMAYGTPIVATPTALYGIGANADRQLLVAEEAADFAAKTVRLLDGVLLRDAMAVEAREFVDRHYSW